MNENLNSIINVMGACLVLALLVGSIVWIARDAKRRGKDGFFVGVLAALTWPFGHALWLAVRPACLASAPKRCRACGCELEQNGDCPNCYSSKNA